MRSLFHLAASLALIAWSAAFAPCCTRCGCEEETDDETAIRNLIDRGAKAAEMHDVDALMQLATKDFVANPDQMDRQTVRATLFMVFRRYGEFSIKYPKPSVEIEASRVNARAEITFIMIPKGNSSPDLTDLYNDPAGWLSKVGNIADLSTLKLWLEKGDDGWAIYEAEIHGFGSRIGG